MKTSKVLNARLPCPRPECGSSDAYHIYDDGHAFCYSCNTYFPSKDKEEFKLNDYSYEFLPGRGLFVETFRKYNVKTKIDPNGKPVAVGFVWPNGATQVRLLDKKDMYWAKGVDVPDPVAGLFGKDRFSSGEHKYVTITEGAYDALSVHQSTRSPAVSVRSSGTAVADCIAEREWLNSFERVYLAFDNDTKGRDAARSVAKLFDFNKVYLVRFDKRKDANEYSQHDEDVELLNIWSNAKRYQPDNIISSFVEFEKILKEPVKSGVPYPFPSLNKMTYGIRTGESVLITAQEGVGKTEIMHAIEYNILKETKDAVGAIFLEEPKRRHLQAIAGNELRRPVHLPDCNCSESEVLAALQKAVVVDERLHVYSHFGSDDPESILDTIRFMASARLCRYILLDHISMAVSGLAGEDERRALDYISTRLEMMVKELDFSLLLVSHVNDDGKTRGSRYISKIADIRIDVTRDITNPDPIIRNTTNLVVSKNRFSGKTGPACSILFDPKTYTYSEINNEGWTSEPANDNEGTIIADERRAA